jgi:hypothetical protein
MDTERLERQLSTWNKLMYMALGSVITLVVSSLGVFAHADLIWFMVQIAITPPGFFLLFGKGWKALPLSRERVKTGLGFLFASWLSLFAPLIWGAGSAYTLFLLLYTVFLGFVYQRVQKQLSSFDEMFP